MFINRIPTRKKRAFTSFTSQYPPAHNDTYVKTTSVYGGYYGYCATNPANSLTWVPSGNEYWSANNVVQNRIHIDLGSEKQIDRIYLENHHSQGDPAASGYYGAKDFMFQASNSAAAFAELIYATDTDWTNLTTDITQWAQHVALDQADPQYALFTLTGSYRYWAMKIINSWSGAQFAIRRIELQTGSY